jgi:phosphotransferase system HPr-like phosphotransfer protein
MKIQVFAEGKTEEKVIERLKQFFSWSYLSDLRL